MRKILYVLVAIVGISLCTSCEEEDEQAIMKKRLIGRWEMSYNNFHGYMEFKDNMEFISVTINEDEEPGTFLYYDSLHAEWKTSMYDTYNQFYIKNAYSTNPNNRVDFGGTMTIDKWKDGYKTFVWDTYYEYNKVR